MTHRERLSAVNVYQVLSPEGKGVAAVRCQFGSLNDDSFWDFSFPDFLDFYLNYEAALLCLDIPDFSRKDGGGALKFFTRTFRRQTFTSEDLLNCRNGAPRASAECEQRVNTDSCQTTSHRNRLDFGNQ